MGHIFEYFNDNDGVVQLARDRMACGGFNGPVVKLASVFSDGFSEIKMRKANVGSTFKPKHESQYQQKRNQISKTPNFVRLLGQKVFNTSPFLERKILNEPWF